MPYADLSTLLARAGRLAPAWGEETDPDYADLEGFLVECSAQVDLALALHGVALPVDLTDDALEAAVTLALGGVAADGALVMAIEATWPGQRPEDAQRLLDGAKERWAAAMGLLEAGTAAVVGVLTQTEPVSDRLGATSFWVEEPDYLLSEVGSRAEYIANPYMMPSAFRGQRY